MTKSKLPRKIDKNGKEIRIQSKWTDEQRAWVIQRLGAYHTPAAIYRMIIAPDFEEQYGFKGIKATDQKYTSFRLMCKRGIKATEIEKSHKSWLQDWKDIPYATTKGRVEALTELISFLNDIKDDKEGKYSIVDIKSSLTEIVDHIRKLIKDISIEMNAEAEREAKAASGTNIYIGRALISTEVTPDLVHDSFIALYKEYGAAILGLQHWSVDALQGLAASVEKVILDKRQAIEADYSVEDANEE